MVSQLKASQQREDEVKAAYRAMLNKAADTISDDTYYMFAAISGFNTSERSVVSYIADVFKDGNDSKKICEDITKISNIIARLKEEEQLQKELKTKLGIR